MEILWGIIIFLMEFTQSYCADRRTVAIVGRKRVLATAYDLIAEALGWGAIVLIVVNMSLPYIVAAILGNSLGTWLVAGRRLKKKKAKPKKKINFTTA